MLLDDAAKEVTPKFVSPADPPARWSGAHGRQAFFACSTNYLIDVEPAVIFDVEATTAIRQGSFWPPAHDRALDGSLRPLSRPAHGRQRLWFCRDARLVAHEHGIEKHVTVFDNSARRDGTLSRDDTTHDHQHDVYRCPGGAALRTTGTLGNDGTTNLYRTLNTNALGCAPKPRCCPNRPARKIPRSIHEGARDMAGPIARSWGSYVGRLRKKVELLFGHLKRILKLDRLRLRGPTGAHDGFLLAATAQDGPIAPTPRRGLRPINCDGLVQQNRPEAGLRRRPV